MACEAMAATSHPLATQAAIETLRAGGTAADAAVTAVALLGVITVGILPGLGIAVVLSLLRFIWGAGHLSLSRLGPLPGKEHSYQVIGEASAPDSIPDLEILRLDEPLFFANALRFRNEVRLLAAPRPRPFLPLPPGPA